MATGCRPGPPVARLRAASRRAGPRRPGRSRACRPTRRTARSDPAPAMRSGRAHRGGRQAGEPGQERVRVLRERRIGARNARSFRKSVVRSLSAPARMIADVVGFGTVWSPRAYWRMIDFAGTPASGSARRCGAYAAGFPDCVTHSVLSITVWIAPAGRVDHRGQVPERDVLVEAPEQERERAACGRARLPTTSGRKPPSRATSMIEPPATFGTPAWT